MSRLIAAENIADITRKSIGIHLIIFCPSSYFALNPHIVVDITIIHGNLTHINTGGSMNQQKFESAQRAARLAVKCRNTGAWKEAMRLLREAINV